MSNRFIIDCNGIIDTWKSTGKCEDKLTLSEICKTLNELDGISDKNLEEYKHIARLEKENDILKFKLESVQKLLERMKCYIWDIEMIIDERKKKGES